MPRKKQRAFTRVPSRLEVDLKTEDGKEITSFLSNLSLRGFYLPTEEDFQVGTPCKITMHLGGRGEGLHLEAEGEIARADGAGVGVRFDDIALQAFEHLQKLVLFNADDPDQIEDELFEHFDTEPFDPEPEA